MSDPEWNGDSIDIAATEYEERLRMDGYLSALRYVADECERRAKASHSSNASKALMSLWTDLTERIDEISRMAD